MGKVEQEVKQTTEGLASKEKKNTTSFNNWPTNQSSPYQLMPERQVPVKHRLGFGVGVGFGVGFVVGVGVGVFFFNAIKNILKI